MRRLLITAAIATTIALPVDLQRKSVLSAVRSQLSSVSAEQLVPDTPPSPIGLVAGLPKTADNVGGEGSGGGGVGGEGGHKTKPLTVAGRCRYI